MSTRTISNRPLSKIVSSLVFTALVCTVASQTIDQGLGDLEGSGDDQSGGYSFPTSPPGSGGGSGLDHTDPPDTTCVRPQHTPPVPSISENGILTEARCHLACLEKILAVEDVTLQIEHTYRLWPTITDSVLERNCSVYQKVLDCRRGCVLPSQAKRFTNVSRCSSSCMRRCISGCDRPLLSCGQDESICTRNCSIEVCEQGCLVFKTENILSQTSNSELLPLAPYDPPILVKPDTIHSSGLYRVQANSAAQEVISGTTVYYGFTTFVFRITHTGLGVIAYIWLRSLDDLLDLSFLTCEDDVLVQYASVGKYGRSKWSRVVEISVYGVPVPKQPPPQNPDPASISFQILPDLRPTFWKHSIINVTWQPPPDVRDLSHYVIILHGNTAICGSIWNEKVVASYETSAVVNAHTPLDGPVGGCVYSISVSSESISGLYVQNGELIRVTIEEQHTIPIPMKFQCVRWWDELRGQFHFTLHWSVPESRYLRDAIGHFRVFVKLESESSENVTEDTKIPYQVEQPDYKYDTIQFPYAGAGDYYRLEMTTSPSYRERILIPKDQICEFDALPLPSATIKDIKIYNEDVYFTNSTLQDEDLGSKFREVELIINWGHPGGNVSHYDVRVTEKASFDEAVDYGEEFSSQRIETLSPEAGVNLSIQLPEDVRNPCVYLQIRSINVHGAVSNWSEPACIRVSELELIAVSGLDTTQKPGISPDVQHVIIGLGVVICIVVLALCVFLLLACFQNQRARRHTSAIVGDGKDIQTTPIKKDWQPYNIGSLKTADKQWELHPSQVVMETKLGHGAFGDVYQGIVKNESRSTPVAIKLLKLSTCELENQMFLDHMEQAKLITNQASHASERGVHIIKILGCVSTHVPLCLVCELPERGDLLSFLQDQRTLTVSKTTSKNIEVGPDMLLNFVDQCTSGMVFLSSIGIVHGDLACRNLYINSNLSVKISDFGLSGSPRLRARPRCYHRTDNGRLPVRWMALESLEEGQFSVFSDVWAFGVTVWEIVTLGGFPYSTIGHKDLVGYLETGQRLERPGNCSQEMFEFIAQCWHEEPVDRPTFSFLQQSLADLHSRAEDSCLITMSVDPTAAYYNVVLSSPSSGTPEEERNSGREGGLWERHGERSHALGESILPSITEDDHETLTQPDKKDELLNAGKTSNSLPSAAQLLGPSFNDRKETLAVEAESFVAACHSVAEFLDTDRDGESCNSESQCTAILMLSSPSPVSNQSMSDSDVVCESKPCIAEPEEGEQEMKIIGKDNLTNCSRPCDSKTTRMGNKEKEAVHSCHTKA